MSGCGLDGHGENCDDVWFHESVATCERMDAGRRLSPRSRVGRGAGSRLSLTVSLRSACRRGNSRRDRVRGLQVGGVQNPARQPHTRAVMRYGCCCCLMPTRSCCTGETEFRKGIYLRSCSVGRIRVVLANDPEDEQFGIDGDSWHTSKKRKECVRLTRVVVGSCCV